MLQASSGLCIKLSVSLTAVCACGHATMVNCAQYFVCRSRSSHNLFTCLLALCTDFAIFRFASHIFLLYLVRLVLTSRMQRTHTTLRRYFNRFCFEFPFKLLFLNFLFFCAFPVCYPFAVSVLCRIVARCLCGIHVVLEFWIGVFVHVFLGVFAVALLCSQSSTVIENLMYLLLRRRVFCLWTRVPGLGQ